VASLAGHLGAYDWPAVQAELDGRGWARLPGLLARNQCEGLAGLYDRRGRFRSVVDMAQHRFGRGEYRYFARPLPALVGRLRAGLYPRLVPLANRWAGTLGDEATFPRTLAAFERDCARAGQRRPTPLLLRYGPGDFNHMHQDLYGRVAFPLQVTCLLSAPGHDFRGGEFLLSETRPRTQSKGMVVSLAQGDAVVFPTRARPIEGTRGWYRAAMRHGVSEITRGRRLALGIIFHDAA
jgi:uncharacterized protein